jgi:uncharacterized membrane protein
MIRWAGWLIFTLALAAVIHWAAIANAPDLIMSRAMSAMGGKSINAISHIDRATAASRTIVKPSPDLLYSHCVFDVSRQPLKITTAAPTDTYWSIALYAANTDNFFVLNDTQAKGQPATIILVGQGQTVPPQPEGTTIVAAPSQKGVVLFRTLINDDAREPELDRMRRTATCDPLR